MKEIFPMVATALSAVILIMTIIWLIQKKIGNAGIVDIAWSYNFIIVALVFCFMGNGFMNRKLLVTMMVVIWGLRLGTYLFIRVMGHIETEDVRYKQLREDWKDKLQARFFGFFQMQGMLNVLLSLPFLLMCINTDPQIHTLEYIGFFTWVIALSGEALADYQLARFKKDKSNKGKVCETGLWYYSRHPNYFFEWMIWVAYFIIALSSPYGWTSIICPLMMFYFLFKVTGIPMTEEQAVKSKGDMYRRYQQTTSAFVPWFKKESEIQHT